MNMTLSYETIIGYIHLFNQPVPPRKMFKHHSKKASVRGQIELNMYRNCRGLSSFSVLS